MSSLRLFSGLCLAAGLSCVVQPVAADSYQIIMTGKVVMQDGSPIPGNVAIERVCDDLQGSAPGPLVNKKGDWIWRMDVDALAIRTCSIKATAQGYTSSRVDITNIDPNLKRELTLDKLVLIPSSPDPYLILDFPAPGKSQTAWKAAIKAINAGDMPGATAALQDSVKASPKFPMGWHVLGILQDKQNHLKEAREAYETAISQDPKQVVSYVTLARVCLRSKDWAAAAKAADGGLAVDKKHDYLELYLHKAVAAYQLKDLAGAESQVKDLIAMDKGHRQPRAEYALGRILEAKGDLDGAREHMNEFLKRDPGAADASQIRAHIAGMGKPGVPDPDLEAL